MNISGNGLGTHHITPEARYGYIPGLDGLRAFAVLLVVLSHIGLSGLLPGGFGVTVFFFISGFLITRLLLAESGKNGTVGLKAFYIRRFLRLLPALYLMLILTWAFLAFHGKSPQLWEIIGGFTYTMNYRYAYLGVYEGMWAAPWEHLWSLGVEEHFYLMFPLLLLFVKKDWAKAVKIGLAICAVVLAWRLFTHYQLGAPHEYTYAATEARLDSIMYGCLLSLSLHVWPAHKAWRKLIGFWPLAIATLILLSTFLYQNEGFRETFRYTLQGIGLFVGVLNLLFWKPMGLFVRALENVVAQWIGRISYGVYLWHIPVMIGVGEYMGYEYATNAYMALVLLGTFFMASLSYYGMEKPIVKLRKKFGSHTREDGKNMSAQKNNGSNPVPAPAE